VAIRQNDGVQIATSRPRAPVQVFTCTLKFPDGGEVSGRIRQVNARDSSPVIFVGDVDRLGLAQTRGTIRDLRFLFQEIAKTSGATLTEFQTSAPY